MPSECRDVCWGAQDPAILALLSRALPASQGAWGAGSAGDEALVWPLQAYLGPQAESPELVHSALESLGISEEGALGAAAATPASWPGLLAAHHSACARGAPSPLGAARGALAGGGA